MLVLGLGPVMDLIKKQQKRNQQGCIGKEMEGVAQVYRMERERETVEGGGTCCELQRRRMALNVQSPTGGQVGECKLGRGTE